MCTGQCRSVTSGHACTDFGVDHAFLVTVTSGSGSGHVRSVFTDYNLTLAQAAVDGVGRFVGPSVSVVDQY